MGMKINYSLAASLVAVGFLTACAGPVVGSKAGDVPPQIVIDPDSKAKTWNDPMAFGPVPNENAAKGEAVCASLNTKDAQYKALGYHPLAKDLEGKPFVGGGYYCVQK